MNSTRLRRALNATASHLCHLVMCLFLGLSLAAAEPRDPMPFAVPARWEDAAEILSPSAIQLGGFLGARVAANEKNRLLEVDTGPLLAGFQHKPGVHPWIGEHIGKWMHAATLAWAYTGDTALRAKLDAAARALVEAQEPDGYLGTYTPDKRFGLYPEADWDVWSHKYNLMGLLTYYQYTGNPAALAACRKMGDLLIATFGPGRKSILAAGTHMGMAATSVLEPMVLLYRLSGDPRYLEFARYLVRAWDEPNGPRIIHDLLTANAVNRTANAKAYEMLSNLVGLCELARVTGDRSLLVPVLHAWDDIVTRRLYVTGSASQSEHFHDDYRLPNQMSANVAETCVTVTWLQLNSQLMRLTGEARFGDELERTLYNHLAAAQRPDGAQWCYFTSLEGTKPYGPGINCCVSSGPRGMALAPQQAYFKYHTAGHEGLIVNLFDPGAVTTRLDGHEVTIRQETGFPRQGGALLRVSTARPATFGLRLRAPRWALPVALAINGRAVRPVTVTPGWAELPARQWHNGDRVSIDYNLSARIIVGDHGNAGAVALGWGPFILAYDAKLNPPLPRAALGLVSLPDQPACRLEPGEALRFATRLRTPAQPAGVPATLEPFADAGSDGGYYRVWLRAPDAPLATDESLLAAGRESRSREGNVQGSITDDDPNSFVVTFDGQPAREDWYAVTLDTPVTVARVTFMHGGTFHDGGWFDTSAGKPRLEVQRAPNGPWEAVGDLTAYPPTTATAAGSLRPGQAITQRLAAPLKVYGVRVVGAPASGDNPNQAFSSCAELQAFGPGPSAPR